MPEFLHFPYISESIAMHARLALRGHTVLPGFGLTLGFAPLYLGLIVLLPLSAAFINSASLSLDAFWAAVTAARRLPARLRAQLHRGRAPGAGETLRKLAETPAG